MSFELAGKVIGDPELSDISEFTVMLALADSTNKETLTCYPSVIRIAFLSRISRRKTFMVLKDLERKGWIQIIRRRGKKKMSQVSIYQIIKYGAPDAPGRVHAVHHPSAQYAPPPSAHGAPKPVRREPRRKPEHLSSSSVPDPKTQDSVAQLFSELTQKLKSR